MDQDMWDFVLDHFEAQNHISNFPKPCEFKYGKNIQIWKLEKHVLFLFDLVLITQDSFYISWPNSLSYIYLIQSDKGTQIAASRASPRILQIFSKLEQVQILIFSRAQAIPSIPLHFWRSQESFLVFQQARDIPERTLSRTLVE